MHVHNCNCIFCSPDEPPFNLSLEMRASMLNRSRTPEKQDPSFRLSRSSFHKMLRGLREAQVILNFILTKLIQKKLGFSQTCKFVKI